MHCRSKFIPSPASSSALGLSDFQNIPRPVGEKALLPSQPPNHGGREGLEKSKWKKDKG
jgi:hypothetical protein